MISKSTFVAYNLCIRKLWCKYHDIAEEISEMNKTNIENGKIVGDLAKKYFPGTIDCLTLDSDNKPDFDAQIKKTEKALNDNASAIAEASFKYGDLYCAVDLLVKDVNGYSIYEVKSVKDDEKTEKLKEDHLDKFRYDLAFQKYVLEKCGLTINHIYIMYINRDYVFHGSIEVDKYFKFLLMDTDSKILNILDESHENKNMTDSIKEITEIIKKESIEPTKTFCNWCKDCGYKNHCRNGFPLYNIETLCHYGESKSAPLLNKGVVSIEDYKSCDKYIKDIKDKNKKYANCRKIQIDLIDNKTKNPHIEKDNLKEFINRVPYPIYYLDFETAKLIIPEFDGFTPNEEYPVQYSLHIQNEKYGKLTHKEFIGDKPNCIREFAESLVKDIPLNSTIMVYNKSMERTKIKYLANKFPDLSDHLTNLANNIVDLQDVFTNYYYYNIDQLGSTSIKQVMPVICPDHKDDYKKLPGVKHGDDALCEFWKMLDAKDKDDKLYKNKRDCLLEYCKLDTLSMVYVFEALNKLV